MVVEVERLVQFLVPRPGQDIRVSEEEEDTHAYGLGKPLLWVVHLPHVLHFQDEVTSRGSHCSAAMCEGNVCWPAPSRGEPCSLDCLKSPGDQVLDSLHDRIVGLQVEWPLVSVLEAAPYVINDVSPSLCIRYWSRPEDVRGLVGKATGIPKSRFRLQRTEDGMN